MLAGELARLSDEPGGALAARKFLNDALIFMQARRIGAEVLTANVRDFDFLDQLAPGGRVVYYRRQAMGLEHSGDRAGKRPPIGTTSP